MQKQNRDPQKALENTKVHLGASCQKSTLETEKYDQIIEVPYKKCLFNKKVKIVIPDFNNLVEFWARKAWKIKFLVFVCFI